MRRDKPWDLKTIPNFAKTLAVLVLICVLSHCASVPHTGRRQFNIVSDEKLEKLSMKAFNEIKEKEARLKDARLNSILSRVVKRISKVAESMDNPDFKWEYRLLNNDTANAVCLPGGKIIVFSGMLKYAKNEAGLAAVVGHEVAHAVARHGAERLSQNLALRGALTIGEGALIGESGKLSRKAELLLGAIGLGATVGVILPYSRLHELEADKIGQIYMAAAGYDPQESIRIWERFAKAAKPPIPPWLSTHPPDEERIEMLRENLSVANKYYDEANPKYGRAAKL
jgi:predicted Zn-dependent protease